MMHALGVLHEHTRPDQLNYVTVHYKNINPSAYGNFEAKTNTEVVDLGTDYSYKSVMHYGKRVSAIAHEFFDV